MGGVVADERVVRDRAHIWPRGVDRKMDSQVRGRPETRWGTRLASHRAARSPGDQGAPRFPLSIQRMDVRVSSDGDFALTEVDQAFFNPSSGVLSKPGNTNVFMPYVW